MSGEGSSPPHRQSPYSPFPFGSPLDRSSFITPSRSSTRMGAAVPSSSTNTSINGMSVTGSNHNYSLLNNFASKGRVRAQEAYGGPVMFGGQASSARKSRLMAASPYAAAAAASRKPHQRPLFDESTSRRGGSSAAATPSPAASPSPSSTASESGVMSSTARLIFDTLEKMSTPVRDAQKLIPSVSASPPRAEKRRLIAEQLDWSHASLKRRRPHLGVRFEADQSPPGSQQLNGPPLRTVFSPVSASPRQPRSTASKSARITSNTANFSQPATSRPLAAAQSWSAAAVSSTVTPTSSFSATIDKSGGGKLRARITEPTRQHKAPIVESDPLPSLLAAHNNALPIKSMPSFNFGLEKSSPPPKPSPASSLSTSASTALLMPSPAKSVSSESANNEAANTSFLFSAPSLVTSAATTVEDAVTNGIVFSFCQPGEVVKASSALGVTASPKSMANNSHGALPDLTASMRQSPSAQESIAFVETKSAKSFNLMGSRNHMLPDVTASAGVKVASELRQESVLSILGGGSKNSAWASSSSLSKKPWH